MLNTVTFSGSLSHLVESIVELEIGLGAVARVRNFCLVTPQEDNEDNSTTDEDEKNIPENWTSSGHIQFDDVGASYKKMDESSHQVLNSVSFAIRDGGKLGLSGRTGSGKSSIVSVLLRMIDYTGSITIDGRELRTIPREILRSRIITLTQDGIQLKGSIRLNLDPYNHNSSHRLSDEALVAALNRVGLWETVQNCGGLDADMAASNLSQGQRQLLGIARAILRTNNALMSKIVILDEATSSIENKTDRSVQATIAEVFANCTIITISHRVRAFEGMGKVVKLEEGKVESIQERDPESGQLVDV